MFSSALETGYPLRACSGLLARILGTSKEDSMLRLCIAVLLALAFSVGASAQVVVAQRNVNVRPTPSNEHTPLAKLLPGDEADLLDVAAENSYLPVRTGGGLEGWVWSRNVTVDSTRESTALGIPVYERSEWKHWIDENGNCRNARAEALIRDATGPVEFREERECAVAGGIWVDPFSGDTMRAPADLRIQDIHIDHMVPLKTAHEAGGWRWNAAKKERYANDLSDPQHLLTVLGRLNMSKGDRGPNRWMPPDTAFWCEYGLIWERIKLTWNLRMTAEEAGAVEAAKARCQ
jgi:hypothetical protein